MPLHTHVFSFTHNAVFSQVLDVFTPKIKRPFFDFYILWIKTNVAYTRLEMIARTNYCTTTTASNWFVTLYYKLLPAVRSSSKHGRWRSSLLLYSISMSCRRQSNYSLYDTSHTLIQTLIESIHFTHAWSLTKGVPSRSIPHSNQSNAWPCSDLAGKLKVHLHHVHVVLLNDLNTV